MDWRNLFTSMEGRINRKPYWIGSLVLGIAGVIVQLILIGIFGPFIALFFSLVWLYPYFALNVKRAHDRNRPTWLIILFFALMIVATLLQPNDIETMGSGPSMLYIIVAIPWIVLSLFLFVDLGFLRGTPGPNQYGSDPLA